MHHTNKGYAIGGGPNRIGLMDLVRGFKSLTHLSLSNSDWYGHGDKNLDVFEVLDHCRELVEFKFSTDMEVLDSIGDSVLDSIKKDIQENRGSVCYKINQLASLRLEVPKPAAPCIMYLTSYINPAKLTNVILICHHQLVCMRLTLTNGFWEMTMRYQV